MMYPLPVVAEPGMQDPLHPAYPRPLRSQRTASDCHLGSPYFPFARQWPGWYRQDLRIPARAPHSAVDPASWTRDRRSHSRHEGSIRPFGECAAAGVVVAGYRRHSHGGCSVHQVRRHRTALSSPLDAKHVSKPMNSSPARHRPRRRPHCGCAPAAPVPSLVPNIAHDSLAPASVTANPASGTTRR